MTRSARATASTLGILLATSAGCDSPADPPPAVVDGGGKADGVTLDPCEAAAVAVTRCAGPPPADFARVCAANLSGARDDERAEMVADLQAIARAGADCQVPPSRLFEEIDRAESLGQGSFGSKLFAIACTPVILTAGVVNRARNADIDDRAMPSATKGSLRPLFEHSVDDAFVYFDADLINEWSVGDTEFVIGDPIYGQTIGDRVYITEPYLDEVFQDVIVGHEMVHVRQAECFGGKTKFAWHYCEELYKGGFDYWQNDLELAAYALEGEIAGCVSGDCAAAPVSCDAAGAD